MSRPTYTNRQEENVRRKNKKEKVTRGNRQIVVVAYCLVALFFCMIFSFVNFMITDSQKIINNPYNKRQELLAKRVTRGKIVSKNGKVLAYTKTKEDDTQERVYPYGKVFCHVVGRTSNSMTGIEQSQCFPLLTSHSSLWKQLTNAFQGKRNQGDSVVTTLDENLQQIAYNALGDYKGAVVALNPSNGKILAMVSKPSYDPNTVSTDWTSLVQDTDENSALLNRSTQGLYPPGSTFKLLTAMEYIRENKNYRAYRYQCEGKATFSGNPIQCYDKEVHGSVNLTKSLAQSCNCSFANIGVGLNKNKLYQLCQKFYFNQSLPVEFSYQKSKYTLNAKSNMGDVVQTVIGQGKTEITPLQNALISATIANHGKMMIPYVVSHIKNDAGKRIKIYEPKSAGRIISRELSQKMTHMMKAVVSDGTARQLSNLPYAVAGKTGSAETDSQGTTHAWFVGFAPASHPKIVVSIIVEGAGTGSQYAVPIAQKMFESYLK